MVERTPHKGEGVGSIPTIGTALMCPYLWRHRRWGNYSAKNMLVFGVDEHNIVKSPGMERISTPVEHKATVAEPSGSVVSLCDEAGSCHP